MICPFDSAGAQNVLTAGYNLVDYLKGYGRRNIKERTKALINHDQFLTYCDSLDEHITIRQLLSKQLEITSNNTRG